VNEMRNATPNDIVKRLTGDPYRMTSELPSAIGWGMGDAQLNITSAVNEAIELGYVRVVEVRDRVRFIALADGIAYCRTCLEGCNHTTKSNGGTESCGHSGCWGPDDVTRCPGAAYARACGWVMH
jgi:hypothetical protein